MINRSAEYKAAGQPCGGLEHTAQLGYLICGLCRTCGLCRIFFLSLLASFDLLTIVNINNRKRQLRGLNNVN